MGEHVVFAQNKRMAKRYTKSVTELYRFLSVVKGLIFTLKKFLSLHNFGGRNTCVSRRGAVCCRR